MRKLSRPQQRAYMALPRLHVISQSIFDCVKRIAAEVELSSRNFTFAAKLNNQQTSDVLVKVHRHRMMSYNK